MQRKHFEKFVRYKLYTKETKARRMDAIDTDDVNDNGLDLDQDTFNGFVVGLQAIVVCLNHSWK